VNEDARVHRSCERRDGDQLLDQDLARAIQSINGVLEATFERPPAENCCRKANALVRFTPP
jgi:hypothetical protein